MKDLDKIGRILFAVPFLLFGISHLMNGPSIASYVPSYFPFATLLVYITGIIFIAVAISMLTGKHLIVGLELLALQLAVFIVFVHIFGGSSSGGFGFSLFNVDMLKDIALLGATLMMLNRVSSGAFLSGLKGLAGKGM